MSDTPTTLVHKRIAVKQLNQAQGTVEAVISTFGVKDRDGDIMLAAAFASSSGKSIPMVWSHDWDNPIGKGIVQVTPTEAIFQGSFFLDTERGSEAFKTVKNMGDLQEWSIGFRILDATDEKTGDGWVRTIRDIELFEASPVLVGAAFGTRTIDVKHCESCEADADRKAAWDTAYVNNLPDSAFAVILDGGEKDEAGKTVPRSLRKLPHHNDTGTVDEPHLRNALSREPQTDMPEADHAKAKAHLAKHASALGIGESGHEKHEEKAGRTMSQRNLDTLHNAIDGLMTVHSATCDMGDECPMQKIAPAPETKGDIPPLETPDRRAQREELDRILASVKLPEREVVHA